MKTKKAFTLIELLIVIAIIGVIATISIIALSNARAKSRDAKRAGDMKQIQTALELFFNDKNRYPTVAEWNTGKILSANSGSTSTYMQIIPSAPTPNDGSCTSNQNIFSYNQTENGNSYTISFCLGNTTGTLAAGSKCLTPGGILGIDCSPKKFATIISAPGDQIPALIQQTADGGYIIIGYTTTNGDDFYIVRLDELGNLVPTFGVNGIKTIGDSSIQRAWALDQAANGDFIIGGYSNTSGSYNHYIVRLDELGNLVPTFGVGGEVNIDAAGTQATYALKELPNGDIIAAGQTSSNNNDVQVFKLDATGNLVSSFGSGGIKDIGDAGAQWAYALARLDNGYYVAAGRDDLNGGDMYLTCFDDNGNLVSGFGTNGVLRLGGSGAQLAYSVTPVLGGGLAVTGNTDANNGDTYTVRLDDNGNLVASFGSGGTLFLGDADSQISRSIKATSDGGFAVAGRTSPNNGDMYLIRLDQNGGFVSSFGTSGIKTIGDATGYQAAYSMQETSDGGFVTAGRTDGDGMDFYIVKMDSRGDYQ